MNWNNVKDKLPEPRICQDYLVIEKDGTIDIAGYYVNREGSFDWESCNDRVGVLEVNYWIPLIEISLPNELKIMENY